MQTYVELFVASNVQLKIDPFRTTVKKDLDLFC